MPTGFPTLITTFVVIAIAIAAYSYCSAQQTPPPRPPTPHQLLMREKLKYSNKALEGLSMGDCRMIEEAGKKLGVISRTAAHQIIPTEQYRLMSKNFQEQAEDLERHAREKNLDAATMDHMRITLTCVQCHSYLREKRPKTD